MPYAWAVEILAPLLKKWQTWALVVVLALAFYIYSLRARLAAANAIIAARPKVETRIDVQTKTVTVQGPERVVEHVVKGEVVERIVYRDAATTTTEAEKAYDRTTAPACPSAAPAPWRYVGAVVDPSATSKLVGLRGGVTLRNRVDLGLGFRTQPNAVTLDAGIRF